MLGNMIPSHAMNNRKDCRDMDSVCPAEACLRFSGIPASADVFDDLRGELRLRVLSPRYASVVGDSHSALGNHVSRVVGVGSLKEMRGIAARRIVACVQTARLRKSTVLKQECNAMSNAVFSVNACVSVAPSVSRGNPWPAGIRTARAVNLFPEALDLLRGNMGIHGDSNRYVALPAGPTPAREFSVARNFITSEKHA